MINPLTGKPDGVVPVLRQLAAQENCDGEPYDQMQEAADYIDKLTQENQWLVNRNTKLAKDNVRLAKRNIALAEQIKSLGAEPTREGITPV